MGEVTAYYIPEDQETLAGRGEALADLFLEQGIFLASRDDHIHTKLLEARKLGQALPESSHLFTFAHMGLVDETLELPVPPHVYDAACPACGAEVYEAFLEAMVHGAEPIFSVCRILWEDFWYVFESGYFLSYDV